MKNDTMGQRPHLYHAEVIAKSGNSKYRYSVDYFFADGDNSNDAEVYQAIHMPMSDLGYTFQIDMGKDFKTGKDFDAQAFAETIKSHLNDRVDEIHKDEDEAGQIHNLLENPRPDQEHKHKNSEPKFTDNPGETNAKDDPTGEPGTDELFYAHKGDDNEAGAPKNDATKSDADNKPATKK